MKITSRYEGTCTADQMPPTMPAMPARPEPSKEQCAQLPEMKKQATDGAKSCGVQDMPDTARASCVAAMQGLAVNVQLVQSQCQ